MHGPHESHAMHVYSLSVNFNNNLDRGGTNRAIQYNCGVNCSNRNFVGNIEKGVKVQGGKV